VVVGGILADGRKLMIRSHKNIRILCTFGNLQAEFHNLLAVIGDGVLHPAGQQPRTGRTHLVIRIGRSQARSPRIDVSRTVQGQRRSHRVSSTNNNYNALPFVSRVLRIVSNKHA
jgi:hypothetical protein